MVADTDAALVAARAAGVGLVVTIGIDLPTSRTATELAVRHAEVYATVGLHPHDAALWSDQFGAELEELARRPKVVAIGECGLDFYRNLAPRDLQERAFIAQIELARRLRLPLVIHVRDAAEEALAVLAREAQGVTVVLHCFAMPEFVDECMARGYYVSFAGNVTFKNAEALRVAAGRVREDRLLLETDAPFLSPVPFRGRPNEPARVAVTAEVVAAARGTSVARVAEITTANANRVFGLPDGT